MASTPASTPAAVALDVLGVDVVDLDLGALGVMPACLSASISDL
jgi:hypothetical protein